MTDPLATNPELVWLFAQAAAAAVLSPGNDDTPVGELRLTAAEAGLAAVLPRIQAALRNEIADEIERQPGESRSRTWWGEFVRNGPHAPEPAHVLVEFPPATTSEQIARFKATWAATGGSPLRCRQAGRDLDD